MRVSVALVMMAFFVGALMGCNELYGEGFVFQEVKVDNETNPVVLSGNGSGGGSVSSSTAGGEGDPDPPGACGDEMASCDDCFVSSCARNRCEAEVESCRGHSACNAMVDCYYGCDTNSPNDTRCYHQCQIGNMAGAEKYWAASDCIGCEPDTCQDICLGDTACGWPDDCSECMNLETTISACSAEYQTCMNEPACLELDHCLYYTCAAGDQACISDCYNQHATGSTELDNLYACMACHPACESACTPFGWVCL